MHGRAQLLKKTKFEPCLNQAFDFIFIRYFFGQVLEYLNVKMLFT